MAALKTKLKQCQVPDTVKLLATLQKAIFDNQLNKFLATHFKSSEADTDKEKEKWINQLIDHLVPILEKKQMSPGEVEEAYVLDEDWVQ